MHPIVRHLTQLSIEPKLEDFGNQARAPCGIIGQPIISIDMWHSRLI